MCRAKKEYEQSMRTKLEEKAGSGDFWKCVRAAGLTNKSRRRVNLEEMYDQQGEIKTEKDAVEVWRSYFEALLGGQTEQDEADTCSECEVVQPTICGGVGAQPDLCSLFDMPILQDEVDCAFSRVKKQAAPEKGRYLLSNDEYYCLKRFMACPVWSLLEDCYDSL